jgi:hypothetical protein
MKLQQLTNAGLSESSVDLNETCLNEQAGSEYFFHYKNLIIKWIQ